MKRLASVLALSIVCAAAPTFAVEPTPEHAADHTASALGMGEHGGGEHHGLDLKRLGFQLVNFGLLVFILVKFGGGAINKTLRARHDQLKTDLDAANRLRVDAELRFRSQEQRLANLQNEIAKMRAQMKDAADGERVRLVAAAEEKAKRIGDDTKFQLDQQVKEAQIRLRAEVAAAAVKVADELLHRSVNASDEQRLVQTFVAELGGRATAPGPDGQSGPRDVPRNPPQETL